MIMEVNIPNWEVAWAPLVSYLTKGCDQNPCIPNGKEAWAPWVEIDHFQIVRSAPLQLNNMKRKKTLYMGGKITNLK